MIDKLIEFALNHRLLTVFLIGLVCLWGIVVYFRMPKDIYPELNAPLVKIITENPADHLSPGKPSFGRAGRHPGPLGVDDRGFCRHRRIRVGGGHL